VQFDARDAIDGETTMSMNARISPAYLQVCAKQRLWAYVEVQLDAQRRPAAPVKRLIVVVPPSKPKRGFKPGGFPIEGEGRDEGDERKPPRSLEGVKVEYNDLDAPRAAGTFRVFGPITKVREQVLTIDRMEMKLADDVEARIHLEDRASILRLIAPGDPVEVDGRQRERLHVFAKHIKVMPGDRVIGAELEKPRPADVARNDGRRPEKPARPDVDSEDSPFKPVGETADDPFGLEPAATPKPVQVRVLKIN
jgi:hypothetical protein